MSSLNFQKLHRSTGRISEENVSVKGKLWMVTSRALGGSAEVWDKIWVLEHLGKSYTSFFYNWRRNFVQYQKRKEKNANSSHSPHIFHNSISFFSLFFFFPLCPKGMSLLSKINPSLQAPEPCPSHLSRFYSSIIIPFLYL